MTCRWVGPFLSEFLQSPQTTLSITGKPGSGKTILASVIVDSVSDQNSGYMALFVPISESSSILDIFSREIPINPV